MPTLFTYCEFEFTYCEFEALSCDFFLVRYLSAVLIEGL